MFALVSISAEFLCVESQRFEYELHNVQGGGATCGNFAAEPGRNGDAVDAHVSRRGLRPAEMPAPPHGVLRRIATGLRIAGAAAFSTSGAGQKTK